ncbi:MAG: glycosyltransferase family 4 protein [Bacteroidetes bacterium]|mgnify:CR=1 FL=1|nr:glycosyltransferase family 4 protein [Bacteroidota bacterium]MBT3750107.1 glycosyltransferase family 4 protein [Bacteroidota bacterium]MBT4398865.1 glycosyltransferase family 4 protein [Bacteroidota bacterium]MBT4411622.1 glycosyltransferase family 4 protein [Bacteroidota bacterium]MBT5425215.1 glycosyltransferase family 4 protein [Bacteroidota bacterium]
MNIAVNCRLLQKGKLEGIGWFMFESLKRITENHPEHNFYFIFDRQYDDDFIFGDNVKAIVAGPATRHPLLWYLWFEWRLPTILKRIKADLFFSPDGYLSLKSQIPSVPVIHDINFAHRPKDLPFWTRQYYNYFFPRYARKADRICTVSEYSKEDIHNTYKVAKNLIHVVYNGANEKYQVLDNKTKSSVKQRYTEGDDYFLFIGSIHPRKNLENLILAYKSFIQKTGSSIKLVVVGASMWKKKGSQTGSDHAQQNGNVGTLNLGCACTAPGGPGKAQNTLAHSTDPLQDTLKAKYNEPVFLGRLDQDELRDILGSALALTFVPWFEGFGIPVVEAMYAGVPVLTSTETSLPEVGGDAVLYAHPGSIEEISDQMEKLAGNPNIRQEMIERGIKRKDHFTWDKTASNVWACLEKVIQDIVLKNET